MCKLEGMFCEYERRAFDLFLFGAENDLSGDALVAAIFKKLTNFVASTRSSFWALDFET